MSATASRQAASAARERIRLPATPQSLAATDDRIYLGATDAALSDTGRWAPVIREAGGDRSAVTGGTIVLSDRIVVEITSEPGQTFIDRMIRLVEGAERQKTPNEIALDILLAGLTIFCWRR